jgi:hypothetical protein
MVSLKPHELTEMYACITGDESVGSHGELDANIRERTYVCYLPALRYRPAPRALG